MRWAVGRAVCAALVYSASRVAIGRHLPSRWVKRTPLHSLWPQDILRLCKLLPMALRHSTAVAASVDVEQEHTSRHRSTLGTNVQLFRSIHSAALRTGASSLLPKAFTVFTQPNSRYPTLNNRSPRQEKLGEFSKGGGKCRVVGERAGEAATRRLTSGCERLLTVRQLCVHLLCGQVAFSATFIIKPCVLS